MTRSEEASRESASEFRSAARCAKPQTLFVELAPADVEKNVKLRLAEADCDFTIQHCVAIMSGGIEEPYSIATLPKPLDTTNGRIHAALVHSLNGSRKRKRHEVAVGIDGESINIHNVLQHS